MKTNFVFILFLFFIFLASCQNQPKEKKDTQSPIQPVINVPEFNPDSAYAFTQAQVDFGFRIPNTDAHVKCGDYLFEQMKRFADTVIIQSAVVKAFDGKELRIRNIISSFHPELNNRIFLSAHWDSRPFADQDSADKEKPIVAANDGAASVATLMEVARQLHSVKPNFGVDIIFFDAEDYGQPEFSKLQQMEDSYCLGSQYWAKNLHKQGYYASFGVLLDMVAAEKATFTFEGTSRQYGKTVLEKIWANAAKIGYSDFFIYNETSPIIDDHYYVNQITHIPTVDIVHRDLSQPSGFWKYWHTHQDTMDKINRKSLKAVGQTLLQTIFTEAAGV